MTEITAFWAALQKQRRVQVDGLTAHILTMASSRYACGLRWECVDLEAPHVIYEARVGQFLAGDVPQ